MNYYFDQCYSLEYENIPIIANTTFYRSKKRKSKGKIDNLETVLKKKKKRKIEQISSSLSVNEAEELAMMLLRNK